MFHSRMTSEVLHLTHAAKPPSWHIPDIHKTCFAPFRGVSGICLGDGLYHPFMVSWQMVCDFHIKMYSPFATIGFCVAHAFGFNAEFHFDPFLGTFTDGVCWWRLMGTRANFCSVQVLSLAGFLDACVVALFIALQWASKGEGRRLLDLLWIDKATWKITISRYFE